MTVTEPLSPSDPAVPAATAEQPQSELVDL